MLVKQIHCSYSSAIDIQLINWSVWWGGVERYRPGWSGMGCSCPFLVRGCIWGKFVHASIGPISSWDLIASTKATIKGWVVKGEQTWWIYMMGNGDVVSWAVLVDCFNDEGDSKYCCWVLLENFKYKMFLTKNSCFLSGMETRDKKKFHKKLKI